MSGKYWTIVGYTFKGRRFCTDHILGHLHNNGNFNIAGDRRSVEGVLDDVAGERGIDREDEHGFDSDVFPKLIVEAQAHLACTPAKGYDPAQCRDRCASGQCGEPLGWECPKAPCPE
jgi:hypothetical protein